MENERKKKFTTYQFGGHGVAGPERQVIGNGDWLISVLLKTGAIFRQSPGVNQTMKFSITLRWYVDDYRLARTFDLHCVCYRHCRYNRINNWLLVSLKDSHFICFYKQWFNCSVKKINKNITFFIFIKYLIIEYLNSILNFLKYI